MRIVENPLQDKIDSFEGKRMCKCEDCGVILEISKEDLFVNKKWSNGAAITFRCIECESANKFIIIPPVSIGAKIAKVAFVIFMGGMILFFYLIGAK